MEAIQKHKIHEKFTLQLATLDHKNFRITLTKSIQRIKDYTKNIEIIDNEEINKQRAKPLCFLNQILFSKIKQLLIWYTLN